MGTRDDKVKLKENLRRTDRIEMRTREKINSKWSFYKLTNLQVFAALLKDVPKSCRDAVLPGHFLEDRTVIFPAFEENIRQAYHDLSCLSRTLTLCLRGNHEVQEITSRMFNFLICKVEGSQSSFFPGVHMNNHPGVEDLLRLSFQFYGINIGELARRSV